MGRLRDRLVAHGETFDHLLASLQGEGASVTLLFAGPSGVGKRFTARALAQAMLCERSNDACGECPQCKRVEAGVHEAVLEIRPDGAQIKIDQAREVVEFLHLAKLGRSRIVIVDGAQALNPQAANSLLKILEEPPEGTFFILLAPSPTAVLPTLRSRSRVIPFRSLTADELATLQPAPDWALRAAHGSLDRLRGLLEPSALETRADAAAILETMLTRTDFLVGGTWRDVVREKGAFPRILGFWIAFARDGLVLHAKGKDSLMNPDQKSLMALLAKTPLPLIEALVQHGLRLEAEALSNRDPQLAVEQLFVQLRARRAEISA